MTRDDIIRMAREAGFPKRLPEFYEVCFEKLIVAAYTQGRNDEHATVYEAPPDPILAERERFNALLDDYHGVLETLEEMQAAVAAEREACAKVCETFSKRVGYADAKEAANTCATAIRARGAK